MPVPKILVVDDERVIADTLAVILSKYGYECWTAYQGLEALEKARQFRPHFILMDITMPEMSGVEAGQLILEEQPACKIVFMTGAKSNEDFLKRRFGGGHYVLYWKPFDPQILLQTLREVGLPPPKLQGGELL